MQLTYRGQHYQQATVPATVSKIKFSYIYRNVSYQANPNFSYVERKPQEVQLIYRGTPYRRLL